MKSKVMLTMESRIHGDMYVRFGGGLTETYHRKVAKRCWPSLLKEIADLCGIESTLNTHKSRHTFGSTVTLNNDVPIHVVKELLGHQSVKQTEEYVITEQQSVGREMKQLQLRLNQKTELPDDPMAANVLKMQEEVLSLRKQLDITSEVKTGIKSVLRICK